MELWTPRRSVPAPLCRAMRTVTELEAGAGEERRGLAFTFGAAERAVSPCPRGWGDAALLCFVPRRGRAVNTVQVSLSSGLCDRLTRAGIASSTP